MKISLTKNKKWSLNKKLKELNKRLKYIEENEDISAESEEFLDEIFQILKYWEHYIRLNKKEESKNKIKKKVNIYDGNN